MEEEEEAIVVLNCRLLDLYVCLQIKLGSRLYYCGITICKPTQISCVIFDLLMS